MDNLLSTTLPNTETTTAKKKRKKNKKKVKKCSPDIPPSFDPSCHSGSSSHPNPSLSRPLPASPPAYDLPYPPLKLKLGSSFYEDTDSSEDEGLPDYKIGGYHCMHVGEVLI